MTPILRAVFALTLAASTLAPAAAQEPAPRSPERIVEPDVERRPVKLPRHPVRDIDVSIFVGSYAADTFGTQGVTGVRLGYHITEDVFVQAVYGRTRVSDSAFRRAGTPALPRERETLAYDGIVVGLNLFPGEVFFGRQNAFPSALYLLGGLGSTRLAGQQHQTVTYGLGYRLLFKDRFAVQVDLRNHLFAIDILGRRTSTQNPELTLGASIIF